jgi:hypothetical protein
MAIDNLEIIDFVSIDRNDNVVLTISDHLPWDNENTHLLILQNKLNVYLSAIESGDLLEKYPEAKGRQIIINVTAKYGPVKDANAFLGKARDFLNSLGYGFTFTHLLQ